ncbi:hypothetical protein GJ744_003709 [Endocarpon pusillum]|uniref:Uncharacterized protein n=1 Tax=Endocarpon pusillum TaxID=364733 RepID=A0A8H7ADZ6_9EURO|nr:hypothetical protein GJ744_003709 [Endocarpon pusillum]
MSITNEQYQLVRDAFDESDAVLRIARRILSSKRDCQEVKEILALFLGEDNTVPEYWGTAQNIYDVVVALETNTPERRFLRKDLMDNPWERADRSFRKPFNISVTFARTHEPAQTDAGPGQRAVQLASAKRGRIAILPTAYQDPKYSRLIRDIKPYPGLDVDTILRCITTTLIHQKSHAITNCKHAILPRVGMSDANSEPTAFQLQESSPSECTVWGFQLCKALGDSKYCKYAHMNAESVATICLFLYLLVSWPEWELLSGRAVRRREVAGWIKNYEMNK